jgi:heme/copper-type cytochrome/quinol oxidase subunit 1
MCGRMLDEKIGRLHSWLTFTGFHATFLIQHWLGNEGMPRRYADYLPSDGFTTMHTISTIGSFILGASVIPFVYNVVKSWKYGQHALRDDPWATGTRWSGRRRPRRHGTTSSRSHGSAPSARRSSCTTRTCGAGCRPKLTPARRTVPTCQRQV